MSTKFDNLFALILILIFQNSIAQETGWIIDTRDKHKYKIVKIGDQWWMAENLNYFVKNGSGCYDNKISNCLKYGRLYTWNIAMNGDRSSNTNPSDVKGICPTGWHLPSDAEWIEMETSLGITAEEAKNTGFRGFDEGSKLKDTCNAYWKSQNKTATNSSGFTALPSGYRDDYGKDNYMGYLVYFWSSTKYSDKTIWVRLLSYDVKNKSIFQLYGIWLLYSLRKRLRIH